MSGQQPYRQQGGQAQQPYRQTRQPQRPTQPDVRPYQQPQQPAVLPRVLRQGQARPAQPRPDGQPHDSYGVAPPLVQNYSLEESGRQRPFGAVVALGVFLLVLSILVPILLLVLTSATAAGFEPGGVWSLLVPAATAVLACSFAARVISNGGSRGRPLRALVHLVLGCAVLVLAVSLTTDATGIEFFSY